MKKPARNRTARPRTAETENPLSELTPHRERDFVLHGPTYRVGAGEFKIYVTINNQDDRPFEIFMRADHPALHEWVWITTVLTSWLLQLGVDPHAIAQKFKQIHGTGATGHDISGKGVIKKAGYCPSVVSHLGLLMEVHVERPIAPDGTDSSGQPIDPSSAKG